jgi:RNA polymerase sigma-70 factor (ECF subfamily)
LPLPWKLTMAARNGRAAGTSHRQSSPTRAAVRANVPSFHLVYRQYFDFVWSSVRRFGAEPDAMDDLVQEVFVVIHAKLDTLEKPEALRSWIYSVVRRTVSTYRRAQRVRATSGIVADAASDAVSSGPTPLEQTETSAELKVLANLLAQLDEPKREVFALVELDELTVPEVAAVLGIPLNTAYSRLRAARQAFDAALARHLARGDR